MIKDFLPPVARLSLALTRKAFFIYVGVEALSREDKTQLLLLLEKDDPRKAICFGCNRLARLDGSRCDCKGEIERTLWHFVKFINDGPSTEIVRHAANSWVPFCIHLMGDPIRRYTACGVGHSSPLGNSEQCLIHLPKTAEPVWTSDIRRLRRRKTRANCRQGVQLFKSRITRPSSICTSQQWRRVKKS